MTANGNEDRPGTGAASDRNQDLGFLAPYFERP